MRFEKVLVSRRGYACLAESGIEICDGVGKCQIITDKDGWPKHAISVNTRPNLECENHAIIPINYGDRLVTVIKDHDMISIRVETVVDIQNGIVSLDSCDTPIAIMAYLAALEKADNIKCSTPIYVDFN